MNQLPDKKETSAPRERTLLADIRGLIDEARSAVAATVNVGLTLLYWQIGRRIDAEVLDQERADYGQEILATLSQELTAEYGKGFSYSALTHMVRFTQAFPDEQVVVSLSRQLSWSHFKEILPLQKPLQREFYAEMGRVQEHTGEETEGCDGVVDEGVSGGVYPGGGGVWESVRFTHRSARSWKMRHRPREWPHPKEDQGHEQR